MNLARARQGMHPISGKPRGALDNRIRGKGLPAVVGWFVLNCEYPVLAFSAFQHHSRAAVNFTSHPQSIMERTHSSLPHLGKALRFCWQMSYADEKTELPLTTWVNCAQTASPALPDDTTSVSQGHTSSRPETTCSIDTVISVSTWIARLWSEAVAECLSDAPRLAWKCVMGTRARSPWCSAIDGGS